MLHVISSQTLLSLGKIHGLPLFVYDAKTMDQQIALLKSAYGNIRLDIRYACKALSTMAIVRHIYQQGCGIDTVSPSEIMIALQAGVPASAISFTPSGVSCEEYAFALEKGVHIHVDQLHVLEWLERHYPGTPVTLRFNPAVQAGGHAKLQVGAEGSKFGFLAEQVEQVVRFTKTSSLVVAGVHMHLGSDVSDSASFEYAYDYILSVALHWKDSIRHIDLGGGFKIPYHPNDHAIDMVTFGKRVSEKFERFCKAIGRELSLVIEPGKFLVSAAGNLLMEVTGIRDNGLVPMVYVSCGFNHFLRPMNYGAYHHIVNLSNPEGPVLHYDVVGYLCETDTFATNRPIHEIRRGDILCLMNAGAYGYTMASNYNARPRPAEVLIESNGEHRLIRRAENLDDILRTDLDYRP